MPFLLYWLEIINMQLRYTVGKNVFVYYVGTMSTRSERYDVKKKRGTTCWQNKGKLDLLPSPWARDPYIFLFGIPKIKPTAKNIFTFVENLESQNNLKKRRRDTAASFWRVHVPATRTQILRSRSSNPFVRTGATRLPAYVLFGWGDTWVNAYSSCWCQSSC